MSICSTPHCNSQWIELIVLIVIVADVCGIALDTHTQTHVHTHSHFLTHTCAQAHTHSKRHSHIQTHTHMIHLATMVYDTLLSWVWRLFLRLPSPWLYLPLFPMSSISKSSLSCSSASLCSRIPVLPPAFPFFILLFFRHGMVVQFHGWGQGGHFILYSWRSSYSLGMFKTGEMVKCWKTSIHFDVH